METAVSPVVAAASMESAALPVVAATQTTHYIALPPRVPQPHNMPVPWYMPPPIVAYIPFVSDDPIYLIPGIFSTANPLDGATILYLRHTAVYSNFQGNERLFIQACVPGAAQNYST